MSENLADNAVLNAEDGVAAVEQNKNQVADNPDGEGANIADVTTTQAFSKRLKEKTDEIEAKANAERERLNAWAKRRGFNSIEELRARDETFLEEQERQRIETEAAKKGADPKEYAEEKELLEWVKQKRAEEKSEKERKAQEKEANEQAQKDIADFKAKNPEVDLDALINKNEKFKRYVKGRVGVIPLSELYDDYLLDASETEKAAIAKIESKQERATSSSKGSSEKTYGLTDTQIALAQENGMSCKEYADYMKHIKK